MQGRGEDLPFPNASFDMVSMGYGLRHVADLRALFAEYERALKPNGRSAAALKSPNPSQRSDDG